MTEAMTKPVKDDQYVCCWDMRGQDLIDEARRQAEAMQVAPSGERLHDTLHAFNWSDKPHRVVYDAVRIIRALADELEAGRTHPAATSA